MNAADVLADALDKRPLNVPDGVWLQASLLAQGERQGVAILPDGTLWALQTGVVETRERDGSMIMRLVPLSAEAGDTDPLAWIAEQEPPTDALSAMLRRREDKLAEWEQRLARLESLSAEAGDTE